MTTTEHTPTNTGEVTLTDDAIAYLDGLRAYTALLTEQPVLANHVARYHNTERFLLYAADADEFRTLVHAVGGDRDKNADDNYLTISRWFGPIEVQVYTSRDQVCTRRQVGVETVEVPDPTAPKVKIDRPVYEWDCTPVLNDPVVVGGAF